MSWHQTRGHHRRSSLGARFYQLRGAGEPDYAYGHAALYAPEFSKKIENQCHMIALWQMYYNFGRVHQILRVTPAMEAGLSGRV
jgi:hypothetical protein